VSASFLMLLEVSERNLISVKSWENKLLHPKMNSTNKGDLRIIAIFYKDILESA
jgi:hypothetical protein